MANNKTITSNTLLLSLRMLITMGVSLYTVRVVLSALGQVDYGLFNVISGAVGLLGVMNGALISATQRFLAFELGRNDIEQYNKVFSMMMIVFLLISAVVLIIALAVGDWVITTFLVIPTDRLEVAKWLFYFSAVTFAVNVSAIPYMSSVVAHEKMTIYAYMSIVEVTFKLLVVYFLNVLPYDKLATYGFLTMIVTALVALGYRQYCKRMLEGCFFRPQWETGLFRRLSSFIGWNMFGSLTSVLNIQGQAILLNFFFGPAINAAKAIADRINMVVSAFSSNFYMAVRPQITKSHAADDNQQMFNLVYSSSKFAYYLLFSIALPLIVSMKGFLTLWLGSDMVSSSMITFSVLIIIFSLVNVFEQPITIMIQATGHVRRYEIAIGSCTLLFLPISYGLFKLGLPPYASLVTLILLYALAQLIRLLIARSQLSFPLRRYAVKVALPVTLTTAPAALLSYYLSTLFSQEFIGLAALSASSITTSLLLIYLLGLTPSERSIALLFIKKKLKRSAR